MAQGTLVFEIKDFFKIIGSAELQETQIQAVWVRMFFEGALCGQ